MKVSGRNLAMVRGDTERIQVSCSGINGEEIPFIEGDTVYFTIKETIYDEEKVFQRVITEFEEGKASIDIYPEDTKDLIFKTYVYDVQLTRANGKVTTILPPSNFTIEGEVTYD